MYQPPLHREDRLEVKHDLIETHSLGMLVSVDSEGPVANSIPFLLQRSLGAFGTLQAHMARANTQWRSLDGQKVLVVFQGPQNYITPSFYETKRESGKVVPTWNYAMVQARGIAKVNTDAAWLTAQIEALTSRHESNRAIPWAVSDAPPAFIESQLKGIVGIEIGIEMIDGKWKVSQNRQEPDRKGVAEGLATDNPAMSALVRQYGNLG